MVTIGMNYVVLPGKESVFENAFQAVLKAMEGMAGHSASHLFKDVNNAQNYMILSDWNDKAAFDAFIGSDAFRKVATWGKEQILAGRPKHEVYQR
ncbi:MAG TPA: antibiotic biosynthesis monooxygenase [Planctomycetota bacterium]|nr:antibiotic biosynthesis monooxygenase [Planctomycetota bacterium]